MAQIVNPPLLRPVNARRSTGAGGSRPSLRGETVAVVCPPPAVTVIVSCVLAGCAEPTPSQTPATVTVTDSGEVQLVEVAGRFLDSLPVWSLSAEPLVTIGERVAEDPYMFGGVEDALRLHTGEIVIVEEFDFEFRVFGSDGGFRRAFGGMGEGPGEFKAVSLQRLPHGGFAVADNELARVTLFDDRANLVLTRPGACRSGDARSFHDPPLCYFAGLTGDGTLFSYGARREGPSPRLELDAVVRRPGGMLFLALAADDTTVVIDSVPNAHRASITGVGRSGMPWDWSVEELFSPKGSWAFGPGLVAVGQSGRFEIRLRDSTGSLQRILRVDKRPEVVTRQHLDSVRAWVADPTTARSPAELALQYLDEIPEGGTIPFFSEMRFDNAGRLWVSDYVPPPRLVTREVWQWTIFGEDGLPLARAASGPSGDILELGQDYVLVRERDDMDAERVALYGIRQGG
ncbi:MAG: hypothetical protein OXU69_04755 [Gemmatimonadota bacterium]|nr:hypothetical protein [Gemmatimonadota bacterium]MDE2983997.1 hypothetical protein [Gemmatimonadota bacterium]